MSDTVDLTSGKSATGSLIGTTVADRYLIKDQIGVGGMGTVYLAVHQTIRKRCALKVLHPQLVDTEEIFRRFRQEAKAASKIGHENIVDVSDFGTLPSGAPYFVMEYLEGHDLRRVLEREGPMPWRRAFELGLQIADALQAAHDAGIAHRDVKPENFFLTRRGDQEDFVKVLDFGVAKLFGDDQSVVTRTGMWVGTPEYMSPEQAEGVELDHRVDVYGVGILLYQLICGKVPFSGPDEFDVLNQHVTKPPPRPVQMRPGLTISPRAEAVLFKALEKDREHRHADMAAFARAMRKALDAPDDAEVTGVAELPTRAGEGSGGRRGLVIGLGVAAALAVVGVIVALTVM